MQDLLCELVDDTSTFENFMCPKFRDDSNRFSFESRITTEEGTFKCGTQYCSVPDMDLTEDVFDTSTSGDTANNNGNSGNTEEAMSDGSDSVNMAVLLELQQKVAETITEEDEKGNRIDVPNPTGTFKNISDYADATFKSDEDQKTSFVCLMSAFVDKLFQEAEDPSSSMPEKKRRRIVKERQKFAKCIKGDQLICFLNGAGGTGKS